MREQGVHLTVCLVDPTATAAGFFDADGLKSSFAAVGIWRRLTRDVNYGRHFTSVPYLGNRVWGFNSIIKSRDVIDFGRGKCK